MSIYELINFQMTVFSSSNTPILIIDWLPLQNSALFLTSLISKTKCWRY